MLKSLTTSLKWSENLSEVIEECAVEASKWFIELSKRYEVLLQSCYLCHSVSAAEEDTVWG